MKTAIFSDIHGNFAALKLVLDDIASRQVDRIICLGDLVDGGEDNDAVVEVIKNRISETPDSDGLNKTGFYAVRGNHDETHNGDLLKSNKHWLKQLPATLIELDIIFTHISPRPKIKAIKNGIEAWNVFDETNWRLSFIGHLHFPAIFGELNEDLCEAHSYSVDEGIYQLDPTDRYIICFGAVGYPRGGGKFIGYGIFDDAANTVEFIKLSGPLLEFWEDLL
ncbi:MAG: metallophosphoesterase family protein [Oscillatoriaceae cyanobacterium]